MKTVNDWNKIKYFSKKFFSVFFFLLSVNVWVCVCVCVCVYECVCVFGGQ